MNILYDHQVFQMQRTGGISRYHADLHNGLKARGVESEIGMLYSDNFYVKESGVMPQFEWGDHFISKKPFRGKWRLAALYSRFGSVKSSKDYNRANIRTMLANGKYDIFHPTYYDDTYDDLPDLPPMVLTIHDMIFESYPQFFGGLLTIENKYKLAEKAKKIIAVSEFTKREMLDYYDFLSPSDIAVVYHGIDQGILSAPRPIVTGYPYLLFVGNRGGYKNFYFLVKAMREVVKQCKDLKLICVGPDFTQSEKIYIQLMHLEDNVVGLGRVSDDELNSLYAHALLYISSSLSEGFGIPLLEAMKHETPMLVSDIPVYREVAADAAAYFNPADTASFSDAVMELYENRNRRIELVGNGSERVKLFTKDAMVENTYNVYKAL